MSDMAKEQEAGSDVGTAIDDGDEYGNEKEKEPRTIEGSTIVVPVPTSRLHVLGSKADEAAALATKFGGNKLDPIEAERVRRKIDRHILPLMMFLYMIQFLDKTTLGYSAVLGLTKDTNMTATQYNLLGTLFYVAYLAFEWPQALALQRFPVGKWMTANITCWGIFLMCFAACNNFTGLAILRVGLGACEGSITAGFMIITSMFYTRKEQSIRTSYWFLMNGTAVIFGGLLGWAIQHRSAEAAASFSNWRVFHLICGGLTLLCAVLFWLFFPDSPLTARFLTENEKWIALERLRSNQSGTENKQWKKEQFIEALLDWKLYAFAFMAALSNVPNSLSNQYALIIKGMGYSTKKTTLLGMINGGIEIVTIIICVQVVKRYPNKRGLIGAIWLLPNLLGAIMCITVPASNGHGMLAGVYLTSIGTPAFVLALAWVNGSMSGHTKRTTTNAAFLVGYSLGNLLAPLMWMEKYKPRNIVPWSIIAVCYGGSSLILLGISYFLKRENKRRDRLVADGVISNDPYGYIDEVLEDGTKLTSQVDKGFMDLTDKQNLNFRYPL